MLNSLSRDQDCDHTPSINVTSKISASVYKENRRMESSLEIFLCLMLRLIKTKQTPHLIIPKQKYFSFSVSFQQLSKPFLYSVSNCSSSSSLCPLARSLFLFMKTRRMKTEMCSPSRLKMRKTCAFQDILQLNADFSKITR